MGGDVVKFKDHQSLPDDMAGHPQAHREVALALSAAPEHLRDGAGVYALAERGYTQVRPSSNGFTCIVNRDHPLKRWQSFR